MRMHYFYVLQSEVESFYFGCTSDLRARLKSHNEGRNIATKGKSWRLVYYEAYLTLSAARRREYRIKHHGSAKRYLMERVRASLE